MERRTAWSAAHAAAHAGTTRGAARSATDGHGAAVAAHSDPRADRPERPRPSEQERAADAVVDGMRGALGGADVAGR